MKTDPRLIDIGNKVRAARERAGLTQRELAERIGSTQANISRIEHGVSDTRVSTLDKLAGVIGPIVIGED